NAIQSMEIHATAEISTAPTAISERRTSAGVQSVIAFFDQDKNRYRFVTDFQYADEQVSSTSRRYFFVYRPESPSEILGRQVDFLSRMTDLVVNYASFLKEISVPADPAKPSFISIAVFVNGVEVIRRERLNAAAGVLNGGQIITDVRSWFA